MFSKVTSGVCVHVLLMDIHLHLGGNISWVMLYHNTIKHLVVSLLQIMNPKIEETAASHSFVFLWYDSCEGLDLGEVVTLHCKSVVCVWV